MYGCKDVRGVSVNLYKANVLFRGQETSQDQGVIGVKPGHHFAGHVVQSQTNVNSGSEAFVFSSCGFV